VVLLPKMALPLHIFEPRYKLMIRNCLETKSEFGMVLASNDALASVGCTAEIVRKIRDYPDGRMDILAEGRAIFRLENLLDEKDFYQGQVEYLADSPYLRDADKETKLLEAVAQCHALLFGRPWTDDSRDEASILAYRMAAQLPVELETRQTLLEMRSENERRALLLGWVNDFLPKLKERQRTQQRASGNGHAHNSN
jgi:Lon protease-like protein